MKSPQTRSAWLGLALVFLVMAIPAYADTTSDLFNLFFQTSGVAANNGFNQGERTSLVTKVIAAIASVQRGHEKTAANNLGAFINEVEAMERSGRLPSADADALINSANAIIAQLL
ncbi:MAG: hypothetical protein AABO58_03880 [Acidobacteriota bacterium]